MLINWQPVLGRGTSKTVNTPVKEQVLSQRLNMLLELQLEINLIFIFLQRYTRHLDLHFFLTVQPYCRLGHPVSWLAHAHFSFLLLSHGHNGTQVTLSFPNYIHAASGIVSLSVIRGTERDLLRLPRSFGRRDAAGGFRFGQPDETWN